MTNRSIIIDVLMQNIERPLADPLDDLRTHAWVVILSDKRDIIETFFIELCTGHAREISDNGYQGIECTCNVESFSLDSINLHRRLSKPCQEVWISLCHG